MAVRELTIALPNPHDRQRGFIDSPAPRKVVRAGRRGGKTVGMAILSVERFLAGQRVLYGVPTSDQLHRWWATVTAALAEPIGAGVFVKNETEHSIRLPGTEQRLRGKTAWNADTLRGDYADVLIFDEYQLMNEDAWEMVGAPMLMDNNGDAVFVYTPPSIRSAGVSKARDRRHAAKLYAKAEQDISGAWQTFHFTSHDNPYLSREGIDAAAHDMTALAYRQEILAEDIDEMPGALWTWAILEAGRVKTAPDLQRIVVAIDPAITGNESSNETGIVVAGLGADGHGYVLDDVSLRASPDGWARAAINAFRAWQADRIVIEDNQGGDMCEYTLRTVDANVPVLRVHASRGKATRAEPVAALYEQGRVHQVGSLPELEMQLCGWVPGDVSPDRLDALVWALTALLLSTPAGPLVIVHEEPISISPY